MTEFAVRGEGDLNKKSAGPSGLVQRVAHSPLRWVIAVVLLVSVVTGFFGPDQRRGPVHRPRLQRRDGHGLSPRGSRHADDSIFAGLRAFFDLFEFRGVTFSGPRRTLGFASGVWGVLMFIMGACGSYGGMIFYRVLLGLSEGPQFSLISKTVQRWFPRHEQARANALWMVGSPIGSAIGFPLTIWLVSNYGWRASFYVLGAFNFLLVMPLILGVVKDNPPVANDAPAEVKRSAVRLADVRLLLADKKVWMLTGFGAGLLTYLWGLNSWLPTYLQRVRHFDLHHMGIYSALPFILMFFAELIGGYIADRTGKYALLSSSGLFAAGVLMYIATQVEQAATRGGDYCIQRCGLGLRHPTQYALALRVLPVGTTSTGIGIINGIGNLVGACAPAVIGFIVAGDGQL